MKTELVEHSMLMRNSLLIKMKIITRRIIVCATMLKWLSKSHARLEYVINTIFLINSSSGKSEFSSQLEIQLKFTFTASSLKKRLLKQIYWNTNSDLLSQLLLLSCSLPILAAVWPPNLQITLPTTQIIHILSPWGCIFLVWLSSRFVLINAVLRSLTNPKH